MHLKVLIIEDCEDDAMLLAHYLNNCGFEPKWQRVDSEEGLAEAVEDRRWDIVLCDLAMPHLSPFRAFDCVRRVNPDIPIIIVTGRVSEEKAAQLIQYGVQDVVLKDDIARLRAVIRREQTLSRNRREKQAAELLLATAIENLSQGVALYDAEAKLITCNQQYRHCLDRISDDIVPGIFYGDLVRLAIERGQFSMYRKVDESAIQRVLAYDLETAGDPIELRYHDGRWTRAERHRTQDGGIVTVITDITDSRRREEALIRQTGELAKINRDLVQEIRSREAIEEALREAKVRAQAIFESAVDGVITFNEDSLIETVNPAAEAIFGYAADELKGAHIHHLMLLGGGDSRAGRDGAAPNDDIDLESSSLRLVTGWRKTGQGFPVELTVSPVRLRDRRIYTGIIRDVTERTKLDRMQREFVSVVSHELRTPLTAIQGSLALLNNGVVGPLSARASSMAAIGLQNSTRLLRLIDDILDMEKIEFGTLDFEFEPVSVQTLLGEAVEANRAFVDRYNASIELDAPETGGVTVSGDHGRLLQVLANLLSNAAKYSPCGGTVTVGAHVEGPMVRIFVKDEGPGIPANFHNRIFQKFAQADSSDTRQMGGTGLGLSIAKAIVEHHRGYIGFQSAEGHGTTFHFMLPITAVKAEAVNRRLA